MAHGRFRAFSMPPTHRSQKPAEPAQPPCPRGVSQRIFDEYMADKAERAKQPPKRQLSVDNAFAALADEVGQYDNFHHRMRGK